MYTTILHATDLSENHFDICKKAVEIAKYFDATLHLLHVIELPGTVQLAQGLGFTELVAPAKEDAETVMKLLGENFNIPIEQLHVEVGSIKLHILEQIKSLACQLIILGSHTPTSFPTLLGSTTHAVIHQIPCDVLTLRVNE